MDPEKKIDLLIELMSKNHDTHMNIIWATIGSLVAAIGWILSSKETREFIPKIRVMGVATVLIVAVFHYFLLWQTQLISSALLSDLKDALPSEGLFLDSKAYIYSITVRLIIMRGWVTFVLFSLLCYLVAKVGRKNI
jgi:glucan phosphoethanolaminetransferase (alkaline phosphatase superfamily)